MKKIGFIIPWYGDTIPGGAEAELRGIAKHLQAAGVELEILTTCVKEFSSDWSVNFHKEGQYEEGGLKVIRFPVRKRDTEAFDLINSKFIRGLPVSKDEEKIFMQEMVNSPKLYEYIKEKSDDYSLFVHIPYMFGTAYYGIQACPSKSVLIPCLHEEPYAHISLYREVFPTLAGAIYLAQSEMDLANSLYDLSKVKQAVLGAGVDSDFTADAWAFREKFNIESPFILYVGAQGYRQNVDMLIKFFREYRMRHPLDNDLKLILIGGGQIDIPDDIKSEVIDLGFVDRQDKYNACAASLCLCQPSTHESFSIVIMESWLSGRPVLVHEDCAVTTAFARQSNSGLYFKDYYDFEGAIDFYRNNPGIAETMGNTGREYVLERFTWDVVTKKFIDFFTEVSHEEG